MKTQEMCDRAIENSPCNFQFIPDKMKTQAMYKSISDKKDEEDEEDEEPVYYLFG